LLSTVVATVTGHEPNIDPHDMTSTLMSSATQPPSHMTVVLAGLTWRQLAFTHVDVTDTASEKTHYGSIDTTAETRILLLTVFGCEPGRARDSEYYRSIGLTAYYT